MKFIGKNEKGQMRLSRRAVLMRDAPSSAAGPGAVTLPPAAAPKPSLSVAARAEAAFAGAESKVPK